MPEIPKICFDRVLPRDMRRPGSRYNPHTAARSPARAIMPIGKRWPNGSTLRVRFLGGMPDQHQMVERTAHQWSEFANIRFEFGGSPATTEIRIAFENDGAWSYVGIDNLDIPQHAATMNFGWMDEGTILHEFGHALGLAHEHQNPDGGIQWDEQNVISDLKGPPNFWDIDTIRRNVLNKYRRDQVNGTAFDGGSIMLYSFPASWTTDGFHTAPNDVLSDVDKAFIGSAVAYPTPAGPGIVELPVADMAPREAAIGKVGEEDLYKFTADADDRYTIETFGSTDVVMALYGPDSRTSLIAEDDDSGTEWNSRITAELTPGDYYVQIRHYSRTTGTGEYGIRVSK